MASFHLSPRPDALDPDTEAVFTAQAGWLWYPAEDAVAAFLREGWFEAAEAAFLHLFLRKDDAVIDGGAHAGLVSAIALAAGVEGPILAVEPNPALIPYAAANLDASTATATTLQKTFAEAPAAKAVLACALGARAGRAAFYAPEGGRSAYGGLAARDDAARLRVETVTLATVFDALDREPALVKLDLEGAEPEALDGLGEQLSQTEAVFMVELDRAAAARFDRTPYATLDRLTTAGLSVFQVDPHALRLTPFEPDGEIWGTNVIAARDGAAVNARLDRAEETARLRAYDILARARSGQTLRARLERYDNATPPLKALGADLAAARAVLDPGGAEPSATLTGDVAALSAGLAKWGAAVLAASRLSADALGEHQARARGARAGADPGLVERFVALVRRLAQLRGDFSEDGAQAALEAGARAFRAVSATTGPEAAFAALLEAADEEAAQLGGACDWARGRLTEATDRDAQMRAALDDARRREAELQQLLDQARTQLAEFTGEPTSGFVAWPDKVVQLRVELEAARSREAETDAEVTGLRDALDREARAGQVAAGRIARAEAEAAAAAAKLEEANARLRTLLDDLDAASAARDKATFEARDWEEKCAALEAELAVFEAAKPHWDRYAADLERAMIDAETAARLEQTRLVDELVVLRQDRQTAIATATEATSRVHAAEAALADCERERERLDTALTEARVEADAGRSAQNELARLLAQTERALETGRSEAAQPRPIAQRGWRPCWKSSARMNCFGRATSWRR
ncbi:MAG: FkbM family methyltransferase [Maricaulaceae bacterium]